ncbi:MAG TPA: hypothetical protein VHD31_03205 [Candidatus Paceibacterota bacterium]|nr:hypothetical protein [Candidatus Paceibacterota bacterium]
MNKLITIIIAAVVIIGICAFIFLKLISGTSSEPDTNTNNPTTLGTGNNTSVVTNSPSGSNSSSQTNTQSSIQAYGGGVIAAKDFKNDPATTKDPLNPGHYYIGPHVNEGIDDPTASDNPPYVIEYIDQDQTFTIDLLQEPIGTVRQDMEKFLMSKLGLSEAQMCQLKYTVSVSWRVNPLYAGQNLGFSFCQGAMQF